MNDKSRFLIRNLIKGFIWFAAIIIIFIVFRNNVNVETYEKYKIYLNNNFLVYTIYSLSELFFGIFPPELFMIWALDKGDVHVYITIVIILTLISYTAGWIAYLFGRYLNTTRIFCYIRMKFLGKYERLIHTYGSYLIIAAALTPIPYSAICMLEGAVKYPKNKFLIFTLFRFLRYAVYSVIVWETITLS